MYQMHDQISNRRRRLHFGLYLFPYLVYATARALVRLCVGTCAGARSLDKYVSLMCWLILFLLIVDTYVQYLYERLLLRRERSIIDHLIKTVKI